MSEDNRPLSQQDLERRQSEDYKSPLEVAGVAQPDATPLNADGYVGVAPEYQNAANETDVPLGASSGPDAVAEAQFGPEDAADYAAPESVDVEPEVEADDEPAASSK